MKEQINSLYGNRVRIRVCGLCWHEGRLLMVNHTGLTAGDFWAPPGGGLEFGQTTAMCLRSEFAEETGLEIEPGQFRFACEFLQKPLHAVELYFEVHITGGTLRKGDDPELSIIRDVRFMSPSEIKRLPSAQRHGIFGLVGTPEQLQHLNGFFRI